MKKKLAALIAVPFALGLVACGPDDTASAAPPPPPVSPVDDFVDWYSSVSGVPGGLDADSRAYFADEVVPQYCSDPVFAAGVIDVLTSTAPGLVAEFQSRIAVVCASL